MYVGHTAMDVTKKPLAHSLLNAFLLSMVTVVVLLTIECSHLDAFVLRIRLGIRALAFHKKAPEIRAIVIDLEARKASTRNLDKSNNSLAGWYGMASASFSAYLALNNLNDCAHAASRCLADGTTRHLDLEVAQIILNVTMALALAVHRTSGFDGTFSGNVGRRDKHVEDSLVEDIPISDDRKSDPSWV
jgi:hypothetical protein